MWLDEVQLFHRWKATDGDFGLLCKKGRKEARGDGSAKRGKGVDVYTSECVRG